MCVPRRGCIKSPDCTQINVRDELPIDEKVKLDLDYLQRLSLPFDAKLIVLTVLKVMLRDSINH